MKVLLTRSICNWADEENEEVDSIEVVTAKTQPFSYADALKPVRDRVGSGKPVVSKPVAAEPTPSEAAASVAEGKGKGKGKKAVKSIAAATRIEELAEALEKTICGPKEPTEQVNMSSTDPNPNARDSDAWRRPEQVRDDALNIIAEAQKQALDLNGAIETQVASQKSKSNKKRWSKKQRKVKAETEANAAKLQTTLAVEKPVVAEIAQVESVTPLSPPVQAAKEEVVVKLPQSPPRPAIPATLEKKNAVAKLPQAATPPSSSPRKAVSPVIPVIPRSFDHSKARTSPQSEPQPKSLETGTGIEESSSIIVADSACSPCRSRASSIMTEDTVIITDSSQSLPRGTTFMRRDSEIQEYEQWFYPLNGPYISSRCMDSPRSNNSIPSNLSPTAKPFVPRGQMEQHIHTLDTSARCSHGNDRTLPDPSSSPLQLSPNGIEVFHPNRPALNLTIPPTEPFPPHAQQFFAPTKVYQPHPLPPLLPRPQQYLPPPMMGAPTLPTRAPTPTPEILDCLIHECNRLDMILMQDDLVREAEARVARLALRGLYPDGTKRDPLQVEAWEAEQQWHAEKQRMQQFRFH